MRFLKTAKNQVEFFLMIFIAHRLQCIPGYKIKFSKLDIMVHFIFYMFTNRPHHPRRHRLP